MPPTLQWRFRCGRPCSQRVWDEQHVVFDPESGDTHLLDFVAAEALACFTVEPADAAAIATRLADRLELPADAELAQYVDRVIEQLDHLGLIECDPASAPSHSAPATPASSDADTPCD